MRIGTGNSYPLASQRPPSPSAERAGSFTAALASATSDQAEQGKAAQPDFTSMTRKELSDWMNGKIRSGEMSLDDSSAFLGMTVKIPVGAGPGSRIGLDDSERVNFVKTAQDGLAAALSRHDDATRAMLEIALRVMPNPEADRSA
ncbi:hypothetical protein [Mangrovicella endophytica]|uniref:hypothetical protein n=1 Tax=Mangrovicella endophytica TaxID=2066697 RepID=UPI000C9E8EC4|nr:hypothetical protein [Mangrovicella endophytica]